MNYLLTLVTLVHFRPFSSLRSVPRVLSIQNRYSQSKLYFGLFTEFSTALPDKKVFFLNYVSRETISLITNEDKNASGSRIHWIRKFYQIRSPLQNYVETSAVQLFLFPPLPSHSILTRHKLQWEISIVFYAHLL